MLLVNLFFNSIIVSAFPQNVATTGTFQLPLETDKRGPCPAFNVMSNYGFLPRDGSTMTYEQIHAVFEEHYNLAPAVVTFLLNGATEADIGEGQPDRFDLVQLRAHNKIEHDVSLVRNDVFFGDNFSVNHTLFDQLISYSKDGVHLTVKDLSEYRIQRYADMKLLNPELSFDANRNKIACSEISAIYNVLSGGNSSLPVPISYFRAFLKEERLPLEEGWTTPKQQLTQAIFGAVTLEAMKNIAWKP
ncbi:Chloroperoxidase [Globomyces pollinis-pini]|nr:Chloroperoxidase [Globomyces pollinis-pini]